MEVGNGWNGSPDDLYASYGPAIYRRCLKLLRDREAARDATQDVFVKLLRHRERFAQPENALRWVYRVATNHCLNLLRDRRARREELLEAQVPAGADAPHERHSEVHLARAILSRFDRRTQAVAVGVLVDGMEHDEVAEALQISRRTVARRLDQFTQNARKYIGRNGSDGGGQSAA